MNSKNDQLIEISDPVYLVFRLPEKKFKCLECATNPPPPLSISFYQNELLWVAATCKLLIKKTSRSISHLILKLFRGQICIEVRYSNEFETQ